MVPRHPGALLRLLLAVTLREVVLLLLAAVARGLLMGRHLLTTGDRTGAVTVGGLGARTVGHCGAATVGLRHLIRGAPLLSVVVGSPTGITIPLIRVVYAVASTTATTTLVYVLRGTSTDVRPPTIPVGQVAVAEAGVLLALTRGRSLAPLSGSAVPQSPPSCQALWRPARCTSLRRPGGWSRPPTQQAGNCTSGR